MLGLLHPSRNITKNFFLHPGLNTDPESKNRSGGQEMYIIYNIYIYIPWKSKTKQRMVFRMIHVKDSLLPMGKVWSLDFLGIYIYIITCWECSPSAPPSKHQWKQWKVKISADSLQQITHVVIMVVTGVIMSNPESREIPSLRSFTSSMQVGLLHKLSRKNGTPQKNGIRRSTSVSGTLQ